MGNVPFRPVATGSTTHEAPRAVIRHCHGVICTGYRIGVREYDEPLGRVSINRETPTKPVGPPREDDLAGAIFRMAVKGLKLS